MGTLNDYEKIEIAFINDANPVLNGISQNLTTEGIAVLFQSETIEEGLLHLKEVRYNPVVCFIDLDFYDSNIVAQLQGLRSNYPEVKIIIHSDIDTEETVTTILSLGIDGYLLTGSNTKDFLNAIEGLSLGKKYFSKGVAVIAQKYFSKKKPQP